MDDIKPGNIYLFSGSELKDIYCNHRISDTELHMYNTEHALLMVQVAILERLVNIIHAKTRVEFVSIIDLCNEFQNYADTSKECYRKYVDQEKRNEGVKM